MTARGVEVHGDGLKLTIVGCYFASDFFIEGSLEKH